MPTAPQNDVNICKEITAKIGGWNPPVSSITITLTASGIPTAVLTLDPAHTAGGDGKDQDTALAATMDNLKKWSDRAQEAAGDAKTRADVTVKVENVNPGPGALPQQNVELKQWIVTAAGITGASATGRFALEIQIQHPVALLDRCPGNIGNLAADTSINWDVESYADPVKGVAQAWKTWAEFKRVAPSSVAAPFVSGIPAARSLEDAVTMAVAAMKDQAALIEQYLEWKTDLPNNSTGYGVFPVDKTVWPAGTDAANGVKLGLTLYASDPEGVSIWESIVFKMLAEWQLTVIPTYWQDKLQVMPFTPWAEPSMTIKDDSISGISFPGADAAPVGGVRLPFSADQSPLTPDSFYTGKEGLTQGQSTEVIYIPTLADPLGRVDTAAVPSWFTMGLKGDAAGAVTSPPGHENSQGSFVTPENIQSGATPTASAGGQQLGPTGEAVGAAFRIAAQKYLSLYRSTVEASLTPTCLLLQSPTSLWPEGYVIPGCVARIASGDGKVLFDMYVTEVRHFISADSGEAYSQVSGKYCRGENGIKDVVTPPCYNPIYTD